MPKSIPIYIVSGFIGAIALFCGLTGKKFTLITDARSAAIIVFAAGFFMCSFGVIGVFITKAPVHPLSIAGYILGSLALLTGIVQIFNLNVPILSEPKNALTIISVVIIIKIIIARLYFLLPG